MGISNANATLLLAARAIGIAFGEVATIGKQTFWPTLDGMQCILPAFGIETDAEVLLKEVGSEGDRFLKILGATAVTSFDANDFEGASVIHDFNNPFPSGKWNECFNTVYDGGCMEHIFDVHQFIENIMHLVKPGGYFVGSTCGNNLLGHGFYQFSPEFYYRVFSEVNGWTTQCVLLCEHSTAPPSFWSVADPAMMGRRIELQKSGQLYLMVIARKLRSLEAFSVPQQSDYSAAWKKAEQTGQPSKPAKQEQAPHSTLRRLRTIAGRFYNITISRPLARRRRGTLSQVCFRRLALRDLASGDLQWRREGKTANQHD